MLQFCNHHNTLVSVAYMFHADCSESDIPSRPWQLIGWFNINPGQCAVVYANDLDDVNNRYWYYYAQAVDGTEWSGDISVLTPNVAFDRCIDSSISSAEDPQLRDFRLLDVGSYDNFTVNMTG